MKSHYDPAQYRRLGHELVDRLSDYLEAALSGADMPVLPRESPQQLELLIDAEFPARPGGELVETLMLAVTQANHLHHPKSLGHQVPPVMPAASLAELTRSLLNGSSAIFEMGPALTIMERHVVRFLARTIGFGPGAGGVLTHGGSLGNLTALLAMRQVMAGTDVWQDGQDQKFALLVSAESHYCIGRAVQIMGWGRGGLIDVAVDGERRMRPDDLARAKSVAEAQGRKVLAVVGNACTTSTGAFDPLDALADFCSENGLWLHVDGAHGAPFLLSRRHRSLLRGIERADSVVWDMHKMMLMPSLITGVLYRDATHAEQAFRQDASYIFRQEQPGEPCFDLGQRTLECTKGGLGLTAYTSLRACGTDALERYLDGTVELTQSFARLVEAAEDFELAVEPQANIVCFRRLARGGEDSDALQEHIRQSVVASGAFYIVMTDVDGARYLRLTVINPFTQFSDLEELLKQLRDAASAS